MNTSGQRPRNGALDEQRPKFWKEIYAFAVICLVGILLALIIIPPKARRYWSLLQHEADLSARNAEIRRKIRVLDLASYSLQTDPLYREAAIRKRLGLKKASEEYLQNSGSDDR